MRPVTINANFQTLKYPKTFIAGQLSGVEGYVESIMSGLVAAMSVSALLKDAPPPRFPLTTIVGALCAYLETPNSAFQPMNANFGLLPSVGAGVKDKNAKKLFLSEKSLKDLKNAGF